MDRPDEKQSPTSTSPETRAPALPSVVTAGQTAPNLRSGQSGTSVSVERSLPLHSLRNEIRVWTRDLLIAIGLALVIIVFLYQPVKVEGTSMAPLLSDQERIFINKFVYRFEPIQRGDVVVFWYPLAPSKSVIKRVIGVPGGTVQTRQGAVYVDASRRRGGEVVFNSSLTGYQEVFTDPSYAGQIVCLTYPHIGNVGANAEDEESSRPYIESLIVREFSQVSSNWRSAETAQLYLNRHKIPVIWDIDTRALVRHIRNVGALRGMVSTDGTPVEQLIFEAKQLPSMTGQELASRVTCEKPYGGEKGSVAVAISPSSQQMGESDAQAETRKHRVVAYDYGIKQNIFRLLPDPPLYMYVLPSQTSPP